LGGNNIGNLAPAKFESFGTSSKNWLTMATDPFHDTELTLSGLPDEHCQPSIVRCFREQQTISVPDTVLTGDTWDCVIFTAPYLDPRLTMRGKYYPTSVPPSQFGKTSTSDGSGINNYGTLHLVNVMRGPTGQRIYQTASNSGLGYGFPFEDVVNFGPHLGDTQIPARLIAGGIEVSNVTAKLYQGGTCTTYDTECSFTPINFVGSPAENTSRAWTGLRTKGPMENDGTVAQMPHAVTWPATEGCYSPIRIKLNETDYSIATSQFCMIGNNMLDSSNCFTDTLYTVAPYDTETYGWTNTNNGRLANISTTAIYFTGLPYETKLTVVTKFFVETAPTANVNELALVSPAAMYDERALAVYRNAICHLPPAVPVRMNPGGEWWGIAKQAIDAAAAAGSIFFPTFSPVIAAGATALKTVGDAIEKLDLSKESKNKAKAELNRAKQKIDAVQRKTQNQNQNQNSRQTQPFPAKFPSKKKGKPRRPFEQ
jgi:hypothetical protein